MAVTAAALACVAAPAGALPRPTATPVVTRVDYIAEHLARDPVYISDDVPRDVTPADAAKIRASVKLMTVPTYVAVVAESDPEKDPQGDPKRLIALLHDKLGRKGVYVVVPSNGIGVTADQYGENLPLRPASYEVSYALPYDAGAARTIARFVDDLRSGQAQQRYDRIYAKSKTGWEAKPYGDGTDAADVAEQAGVYSGLAVAVIAAGALLLRRARRRRRAR